MQIFKNFLLACSLVVAASPLYLQAEDTETQAAARAALQQKMRELKGGSATNEALPAAAPKAAEMQPATPAPTEPKSEPVTTAKQPAAVNLPTGASPDLIEQARQATRARMSELQNHRSTAIPAGKESPEMEPANHPMSAGPSKAELRAAKEREAAAKRAAVEQQKAEALTKEKVTAAEKRAAAEQAAQEKAQAEAAAKAAQASAQPMSAESSKVSGNQEKAQAKANKKAEAAAKAQAAADAKARAAADKAAAKAAKKNPTAVQTPVMLSPLEAPASSLPDAKAQALQALTEQYRADKISSEEYHEQRAKILAEP